MEEMGRIEVIKTFFEKDGGRKVQMAELKALSQDEREELASLAAKELGFPLRYPLR